MGQTEQERARLRHLWRELADLALAAPHTDVSEEFRRKALDAVDWLSPLDKEADAFVLFGFARLCRCWVRSNLSALRRRAPMLAAVALEVLHVIGPEPAAVAPPQQRLPYKE